MHILRLFRASCVPFYVTALLVVFLGLAMFGTAHAGGVNSPLSQVDGVCGDLNNDDVVDLLDAIIEAKIIAENIEPTPEQSHLGNVAIDSVINFADLLLIAQHMVGLLTIDDCGLTTTFEINIGDVVSEGVPGDGAGSIEFPGTADVYTFEGAAGQTLYFDQQFNSNLLIHWKGEDPNGGVLFAQQTMSTNDVGIRTLPLTGTYTITVFGTAQGTGTYQFQILDVLPIEEFTIDIGDVVSDGVPEIGAGNIESQGAQDIYTFEGAAGQTLYFDQQFNSNLLIHWKGEDPNGGVLFSQQTMSTSDVGVRTLLLDGEYTITVLGTGGGTGTYQFQILEVPPAQEFEISIGDIVPDDVVGDGAGVIESQGSLDVYTFEGTAGRVVYFDSQERSTLLLQWRAEGPDGGVVFPNTSMATFDPGTIALPLTGVYKITVFGSGGAKGTYKFQVLDVPPPQEFDISIGDIVPDDVAGQGAGVIESQGAIDIYTFEGIQGQIVCFDSLGTSISAIRWMAVDPNDGVVFPDRSMVSSGPGEITLQLTGTYKITVFGSQGAVGTYGFQIPTQC